MIYGMKMLQKLQITQHPQIGGYTSNSNQTTQHPQIWGGGGAGGLGRGDILNPKRVTKHPHMEGGGERHFKPQTSYQAPTYGGKNMRLTTMNLDGETKMTKYPTQMEPTNNQMRKD